MFNKRKQKKNTNSNLDRHAALYAFSETRNEDDSDNVNDNESDDDDDRNSANENPAIMEEEVEMPSFSDNSTSIYQDDYKTSELNGAAKTNIITYPQPQITDYIDPTELSILKAEIQNRFDVQPNFALPLVVEYSLGAISDLADIECKTIHSNVEELTAITDEIIQKTKECNQLVSKLNVYTIKVSNELRMTQKSMQQIKIPRRSLLQLITLIFLWIIDMFIFIYRKFKSRNSSNNNS